MKIVAIDGDDAAVSREFGHADDAGVGKIHLAIAILFEEAQDRFGVIGQIEVEDEFACVDHFDDGGWVAGHGRSFCDSFGTGEERRAEPFQCFACPSVKHVGCVERGDQWSGIENVFHERFFFQSRR